MSKKKLIEKIIYAIIAALTAFLTSSCAKMLTCATATFIGPEV